MFHPFASGFGLTGKQVIALREHEAEATSADRSATRSPPSFAAIAARSSTIACYPAAIARHRANLELPELLNAGAEQTEDLTPSLCRLIQAAILHWHAQDYQIESEGRLAEPTDAVSPEGERW